MDGSSLHGMSASAATNTTINNGTTLETVNQILQSLRAIANCNTLSSPLSSPLSTSHRSEHDGLSGGELMPEVLGSDVDTNEGIYIERGTDQLAHKTRTDSLAVASLVRPNYINTAAMSQRDWIISACQSCLLEMHAPVHGSEFNGLKPQCCKNPDCSTLFKRLKESGFSRQPTCNHQDSPQNSLKEVAFASGAVERLRVRPADQPVRRLDNQKHAIKGIVKSATQEATASNSMKRLRGRSIDQSAKRSIPHNLAKGPRSTRKVPKSPREIGVKQRRTNPEQKIGQTPQRGQFADGSSILTEEDADRTMPGGPETFGQSAPMEESVNDIVMVSTTGPNRLDLGILNMNGGTVLPEIDVKDKCEEIVESISNYDSFVRGVQAKDVIRDTLKSLDNLTPFTQLPDVVLEDQSPLEFLCRSNLLRLFRCIFDTPLHIRLREQIRKLDPEVEKIEFSAVLRGAFGYLVHREIFLNPIYDLVDDRSKVGSSTLHYNEPTIEMVKQFLRLENFNSERFKIRLGIRAQELAEAFYTILCPLSHWHPGSQFNVKKLHIDQLEKIALNSLVLVAQLRCYRGTFNFLWGSIGANYDERLNDVDQSQSSDVENMPRVIMAKQRIAMIFSPVIQRTMSGDDHPKIYVKGLVLLRIPYIDYTPAQED